MRNFPSPRGVNTVEFRTEFHLEEVDSDAARVDLGLRSGEGVAKKAREAAPR